MPKFGYQTIIFGPVIDRLSQVLKVIKAAGFTGIEFSQPPSLICENGRPLPFWELAQMVQGEGLTLLGFAGGSLATRIAYCDDTKADQKPLYLYVDEDRDDEIKLALEKGYTVALHPHVFRSIDNVAKTRGIVEAYESGRVFLIPDTAHIYIGAKAPVASEIREVLPHTIAVHLKDWTSSYGYSPLRYAKGFMPPGQGEVPIKKVMKMLADEGYEGWIVAEQDYTRGDLAATIEMSARYLDLPRPSEPIKYVAPQPIRDRTLMTAIIEGQTRPLSECLDTLSEAILDVSDGLSVSISACSPNLEDIILLSHKTTVGIDSVPEITQFARDETLIGQRLSENTPVTFTFGEGDAREAPFKWSGYAQSIGAKFAVAIPVPLRYNPHYANLAVLVLFDRRRPDFVGDYARQIAFAVSRAAAVSLDEDCEQASGQVSALAQTSGNMHEFLSELVHRICEVVGCEGCTIFLTSLANDRLIEAATTGIRWNPKRPNHDYRRRESVHPTVQCWIEEKPILLGQTRKDQPYVPASVWAISREEVESEHDAILLTPIRGISTNRDANERPSVIGVVRCRNKKWKNDPGSGIPRKVFTEDDLTVLDAMCHVAAPFIDMRRTYEDRLQGISRVAHELKTPVNGLRQEVRSAQLIARDYLGDSLSERDRREFEKSFSDVYALTDLAVRYVDNARLYGFGGLIPYEFSQVGLIGEVIAPAIDQIGFLLSEAGFDKESIWYPDIKGPRDPIPRLWLDKPKFQQVFFNLLSNAIKYAIPSRATFRVEITFSETPTDFLIFVSDWGVGIVDEYTEQIFDEGVRGAPGQQKHIQGLGIGLHVVRQVVEGHKGRIRVVPGKSSNPTTFEISLPKSLEYQPTSK